MAKRLDDTRLGGRVRRYAKVGRAVGGLAARVAGDRYLGIKIDRQKHATALTAALGGLKGPLMKVAQLLATIPSALPREYQNELVQLQSDAPAMGWPFVRRRMIAELGEDWEKKFKRFEHQAAHAASLGQVHRAVSLQDETLACKLQYPDMASVVDADLRQLKLIFGLYERYDKAISTRNIHAEIAARLREELDYALEAKHMQMYRHMLRDEKHVHVPAPVASLSTNRLITMTWLDGARLDSFTDAPVALRNTIALNMFRAWYVPFYEYGVIHGDPHLGNYSARPDGDINLLDFGCVRVFPPSFVKGVIDLYKALRDDDEALAVEAYRTWGFTDLRREVLDVLNIWARFVYAPLMDDRARPIQHEEHERANFGAKVAGRVHEELQKLGGVAPPREFVLMDRAAIGLGSVFMRLKAEVNWHRLFHDMIEDFDVAELDKRQRQALAKAGIAK